MLTTIRVLDKGFVSVYAVHGDEMDIPKIARVSTGSQSKGKEQDKKLIEYLLKHKHMSPFEFTSVVLHIKAPLFVARQWFRHRIGVSYSEKSMRYSAADAEFYIPKYLRGQDNLYNKQGSSNTVLKKKYLTILETQMRNSVDTYQMLIDAGVAKEMARLVLPTAIYTEFYFKANLRSLMHFLDLRLDSHAQFETVEYAKAVDAIFKEYFPTTYKAYKKHIYAGDLE